MENDYMAQNNNKAPAPNNMCMDWDDVIEVDGQEFITIREGDYNFRVTGFTRGQFPGSAKIPMCNKATLSLEVYTPDGTANAKLDLIMYRTLEWRISAFFRSVGMKKSGEKLVMNWTGAVGRQGRAHFKPRKYTDRNGNERTSNDVDYFIDYDPKYFGEPGWVQAAEHMPEEQMQMPASWKDGRF